MVDLFFSIFECIRSTCRSLFTNLSSKCLTSYHALICPNCWAIQTHTYELLWPDKTSDICICPYRMHMLGQGSITTSIMFDWNTMYRIQSFIELLLGCFSPLRYCCVPLLLLNQPKKLFSFVACKPGSVVVLWQESAVLDVSVTCLLEARGMSPQCPNNSCSWRNWGKWLKTTPAVYHSVCSWNGDRVWQIWLLDPGFSAELDQNRQVFVSSKQKSILFSKLTTLCCFNLTAIKRGGF